MKPTFILTNSLPVILLLLLVKHITCRPVDRVTRVQCVKCFGDQTVNIVLIDCHGRQARQTFLGDNNTPVIKYNSDNEEGAKIAQQIASLFRTGDITNAAPVGGSKYNPDNGFPAINRVNMTLQTQQAQSGKPSSATTPFQLNVNLNLELENGKPSKVRVPQGELMLMYLPQIRGPTGSSSVELSNSHLRKLLQETENPTKMVMLPTGGILLMSLTPYPDTDSRDVTDEGQDSADGNKETSLVGNNLTELPKTGATKATNMATTTEFNYPDSWKDTMPKFPYVPSSWEKNTKAPVTTDAKSDDDNLNVADKWEMPVFPQKPAKYFTTSTSSSLPTSSSTSSTVRTKMTVSQPMTSSFIFLNEFGSVAPANQLFDNEIEVHTPKFKLKKPMMKKGQIKNSESTFIPIQRTNSSSNTRNLVDLYERLKSHYRMSNGNSTSTTASRKKYRKDDSNKSKFDNINVVVPGRFNPKPSPNSVTQCKKDSSTNGTRVCSSFVPNNCQGGFKIGGNCNQQNRLDNTKLPPSEFQMGESQVSNSDLRFVPFTPQQANMNMQSQPRTSPPLNLQFPKNNNQDIYKYSSTTTTRRPRTTSVARIRTTAPTTTTMSSHDELVHRVMNMDPPELRDALMDPMMMAIGTMLAMSGAYMAISIQETAAANALAFALGGRKKRKK